MKPCFAHTAPCNVSSCPGLSLLSSPALSTFQGLAQKSAGFKAPSLISGEGRSIRGQQDHLSAEGISGSFTPVLMMAGA